MKEDIMAEICLDFYNSGDNELLMLPEELSDEFWTWFSQNATELPAHDERFNQIQYEGYLEGRCFGNSQSIFCHSGVPYYEGFVKCGLSFIHHGYNVYQDMVHDVTFESNPNMFIERNIVRMEPYYGVEIPAEIVHQYTEKIDLKGYNKPLLFNFYLSVKDS